MAEEWSTANPRQNSNLWCYRCSKEVILPPNLVDPADLATPSDLACPYCCGGFLECLTAGAPAVGLGHPPCPALRRRRRPAPSNDPPNSEGGSRNEDEVLELLRHLFASPSSSSSSTVSPPIDLSSSAASEAVAALLHQQEALRDSILINEEAREDTISDTDVLQLAIAWFSDEEEEEEEEEEDPVGLEEGLVDIELSSSDGNSISVREEEEEEEEEDDEVASSAQNPARPRENRHESEGGGNSDSPDNADYTGNPNDYMDDSQGFELLLQELAEIDQNNNRQGAPPASKTTILSLPLIAVEWKHIADDSATCAVCKETADIGEWVKQLPCLHLYHEECIIPWLRTRNSCPICRFELPTDDPDYERLKRYSQSVSLSASPTMSDLTELQLDEGEELELEASSEEGGTSEEDERLDQLSSSRRWQNWVCFTAGSILRAIGFVLVVYLGSHILNTRLDQQVRELQRYLRKLGEMPVPKQWWMMPFKH